MLDFPNAPTVGQVYGSSPTWTWDGAKWVASGAGVGGYLPLSGGTLSGPLTVNSTIQAGGYQTRAGTPGPATFNYFNIQWDGTPKLWIDNVLQGQLVLNSTLSGYLPLTGGTVSGPILVTSPGASGQFRMAPNASGTGYGSFWRNDSTITYLLLTNNNDAFGAWNGLRPFFVDNASGLVHMQNGAVMEGSANSFGTSLRLLNAGGSYLQLFDDGNSHIESSTALWLNGNTAANINLGGSVVVQGAHSLTVTNGNINISGNYQINGGVCLLRDANYVWLNDSSGHGALFCGGDTTRINYYRNTQHIFQGVDGAGDFSNFDASRARFYTEVRAPNFRIADGLATDGGSIGFLNGNGPYITMMGTSAGNAGMMIFTLSGAGTAYAVAKFDQSGHFSPWANATYMCGINAAAWGACYSYAYNNTSDRSLKQDIEPVGSTLDHVLALNPSTWRWKHGIDTERRHHGFVADDVRDVLGEDFGGWIAGDGPGQQALAYNELIAVLWKAVQELAIEVQTLKES